MTRGHGGARITGIMYSPEEIARLRVAERVACMRDIAAELRCEGRRAGHWTDEKVIGAICAELERRATALETGEGNN